MLDPLSFQYAMENTRVIRAPQRQIETFGSTSFKFYLVTELMDVVGQVRVRDGQLTAERPRIITPGYFERHVLDGFGERAGEFLDWLREHQENLAILRYGFQFKKTNVNEEIVHCSVEDVIGRINEKVDEAADPMSVVIHGVDEGWEVSLLKFTSDLIQGSAPVNVAEWKKRGLI